MSLTAEILKSIESFTDQKLSIEQINSEKLHNNYA